MLITSKAKDGNFLPNSLKPGSRYKTNVIAYTNSKWRYIGANGISSKPDGEFDPGKDISKAEFEANRNVLKAAVKERIIELNAENLGKIKERPLDTGNDEEKIFKTDKKKTENSKDAGNKEAALIKPIAS